MKCTYSFQRKEKYLCMVISGEYDKMEFLSYPAIISKHCEKEKVYKVLIIGLDLQNSDAPAMDRFFLGEEIARTIGSKIKLAAVWQHKYIDKFTENVAVNRGSHIKVFGEVDAAEKWLLDAG